MTTPDNPFAVPAAAPAPWVEPPASQWGPPPGHGWAPYGSMPPQQPGTNGWCVAALVTGILPLPPVAIGCGIAGLVQTGDGRQRGRGLAVAGLVLGGLWGLLLAGFLVLGFSGAFDYESEGPLSSAPSTTPGTCLSSATGAWAVSECSSPHDAEVYHVARLTGRVAWPGEQAVADQAADRCESAFRGYVGESYYTSDHEYAFFAPDRVEWARGERRAVCLVVAGYSDLPAGSVKES